MQAKRMDQHSLQLHDVHNDDSANAQKVHLTDNDIVEAVNSTREQVRERLHVVDDNGDVWAGIDAFIVLWENTPADRWKARLLRFPIVYPVSSIAYNLFARALYRWNRKKGHW